MTKPESSVPNLSPGLSVEGKRANYGNRDVIQIFLKNIFKEFDDLCFSYISATYYHEGFRANVLKEESMRVSLPQMQIIAHVQSPSMRRLTFKRLRQGPSLTYTKPI